MRAVWCEEIFGPVAPVLAFCTLEQAAELVNDSEYGLSVGILGEWARRWAWPT